MLPSHWQAVEGGTEEDAAEERLDADGIECEEEEPPYVAKAKAILDTFAALMVPVSLLYFVYHVLRFAWPWFDHAMAGLIGGGP